MTFHDESSSNHCLADRKATVPAVLNSEGSCRCVGRGAPQRGTSEDAPRSARTKTPLPNRGDKSTNGARGTKVDD